VKRNAVQEKYKAVASVKFYNADRMTPVTRKQIAEWLREQAKSLVNDGSGYDPKFEATYWMILE
jgi:hypothetical protein